MERLVDYKYSSIISYAFGLLSPKVADRLKYVHFFTGTDPIYAGLHSYVDTGDKRSYRNTAHACYPWHTIDKSLTVVLPEVETPYVIIHELGHILDFFLGFRFNALPVNDYAKTDRGEAFAEAFACQYFYLGREAENIFQSDKGIQYLFQILE
jgi:hypothetical protein